MKILPTFFACLAAIEITTSGLWSVAADTPNAAVAGRYEAPEIKDTYVELRPDGTGTISFAGDKHALTYTVKGNTVTLISPGGPPLALQWTNGVMTSPAGGAGWPRVGDTAAAAAVAKTAQEAAARNAGVSGHYGTGTKDVSLELRPDGGYIMVIGPVGDAGAYTVKGSTVTLTNPHQLATVYELSNGILSENGEAKWARMDYVAPPPGPKNAEGKAGRYVATGNLDTRVDIRPDGTFTLVRPGQTISGTYSVQGTAVSLQGLAETVQIADGVLIGPHGTKWLRVWEAAPPPTAVDTTANAKAVDRAKSLNNVQRLCIASQVWAEDHRGKFEDDPHQLIAGPYRAENAAALHCPLLHDDSQDGYEYYGKGLKWKRGVDDITILFLSKWHDAAGRRVIGHADSTIEFAVPKSENVPESARASFTALTASPGAAAPPPNPSVTAKPPGSPVAGAGTSSPPAGITITLNAQNIGGRRSGAAFPAGQMPPNPANYFWVVDRPDGQTKVADLRHNEWHVAGRPGTYKIRVEYRSGGVNQTVSNVLEVTVPGK